MTQLYTLITTINEELKRKGVLLTPQYSIYMAVALTYLTKKKDVSFGTEIGSILAHLGLIQINRNQ